MAGAISIRSAHSAKATWLFQSPSVVANVLSTGFLDRVLSVSGVTNSFATNNDNLEEIFENKEQIEVSRFYERLPKPQAIAVKEWLEGKVYFRETE